MAGLADQPGRQKLVDEARAAIARGDGIDAEMKLRAAMQQGANRQQVAAYMGEAYLAQENPRQGPRLARQPRFHAPIRRSGLAGAGGAGKSWTAIFPPPAGPMTRFWR
ncbi:hypothetical protein ACFSTD_11660 [Novosphingobium colocasiae]